MVGISPVCSMMRCGGCLGRGCGGMREWTVLVGVCLVVCLAGVWLEVVMLQFDGWVWLGFDCWLCV